MEEIKYFEIDDMKVPYKPSRQVTTIDNGVEIVQDIYPPHIVALQRRQFGKFMGHAAKEIILTMTEQLGLSIPITEAPIALSAMVPKGHFAFDGNRIILNEDESLIAARDADGDRGALSLSPDENQAVLIKFPITQQPPLLKRATEFDRILDGQSRTFVPEKFYTLEISPFYPNSNGEWEPNNVTFDIKEQFLKTHSPNNTAIITSLWNVKELKEAFDNGWGFKRTIRHLCSNPDRYEEIENGELKAASKDNKGKTRASVMDLKLALTPKFSVFLTSRKSVGTMDDNRTNWVLNEDLLEHAKNVQTLQVSFRTPNPRPQKKVEPKVMDPTFLQRLLDFKKLRVSEPGVIPSHNENLPEAVIIWATDTKGAPVALTETKRGTLGFAHVLYPVYEAETGKIYSPIEYLAKKLSYAAFTDIKNPETGRSVGKWPRRDKFNPKKMMIFETWERPEKIAMLHQMLSEHCGTYGDVVPSKKTPNGFEISCNSAVVSSMTVVIDYGNIENLENMWLAANKLNEIVPICMAGGKSNNEKARKYVLANKNGLPIWLNDDTICHPRRAANQRAQLLRSENGQDYRVAVVLAETKTQVLICNSGVEKQQVSTCFLPRITNTRNDEMYPEEREITTWSGARRKIFQTTPRQHIQIGKLVDSIGNKFMPRWYSQAFCENEPIDLIIPIQELVDKSAHVEFLKGFEEKAVRIGDQTVTALVGIRKFYRTGSESENVPPSKNKILTVKGIDKFPILNSLRRINANLNLTVPPLEYQLELQKIMKRVNHCYDNNNAQPEGEEDYY